MVEEFYSLSNVLIRGIKNKYRMLNKDKNFWLIGPYSLFSWSVLCRSSSETSTYYFSTVNQWDTCGISFLVFFVELVCSITLEQFLLIWFKGFGNKEKNRTLWQCSIYGILWLVLLEKNVRILKGISSSVFVLWDRIFYMASHWSAHGHFRGNSLSDMLMDWTALLHY